MAFAADQCREQDSPKRMSLGKFRRRRVLRVAETCYLV
jgi:hypothetical protein